MRKKKYTLRQLLHFFDADTGKILHEQNPDELLAIASMSKLIVVYAVLEAIKEGKITWDTR